MKFSVRWKELALDDLTAIWLRADSTSRVKITGAAREVDRLLQNDPALQGESREGDRRIMFVAPLAVSFRVLERNSIVHVLRIRRFA